MARFFIFILSLAGFSLAPAGAALAAAGSNVEPYFLFGGFVAGAVCIWLGLFLIKRGRDARRTAQASAQWPVADGKVLSAIVAKKSHRTAGIYHVPRVTYAYAVAGKPYQGDVICPGIEQFGLGSTFEAHARADRYPVGKTVPVHYDPNDPARAVLETIEIGGMRNIFGGAVVLLLAAFFIGLTIVVATVGID